MEAATFSLAALVGQEGFDLSSAHLIRVPEVVEKYVAFNQVDVALLGMGRVVFEANGVATTSTKLNAGLVEQFLGSCFPRSPQLGFDFY